MEKPPKKKNQINVELPEEVSEGTYSNLAIITHSTSEFVIDFVRILPGMPKARVKSRIVLTPQHAKRFLKTLGENVLRFEAQHGVIDEKKSGDDLPPVNYGGPPSQA